ncbi:PspC domain-containing protein [Geodermatophilus sp. SYSU D00742]
MTSAVPPTPPPVDSPSWSQPPARTLRRSGTDRMVGGVSGGLAEYTGIDAVLWRAAFVLVTLAGGAGVLVYLLLWVLMPAGPLPAGQVPGPLDQLAQRLHDALTSRTAAPRS